MVWTSIGWRQLSQEGCEILLEGSPLMCRADIVVLYVYMHVGMLKVRILGHSTKIKLTVFHLKK